MIMLDYLIHFGIELNEIGLIIMYTHRVYESNAILCIYNTEFQLEYWCRDGLLFVRN